MWRDQALSTRARLSIGAALLLGGLSAALAGGVGALLVFVLGGALTALATARLAPIRDGAFPTITMLVGYGARSFAAMALHVILAAQGRGGALFLDDAPG